MGRAKVAVGVMAACTLMAVGLVLVGRPDEAERIIGRYGTYRRTYVRDTASPGEDDYVSEEIDVAGNDPAATGIYRDLIAVGWKETSGKGRGVVIEPPDPSRGATLYPPKDGRIRVEYIREPNRLERLSYHLANLFGLSK